MMGKDNIPSIASDHYRISGLRLFGLAIVEDFVTVFLEIVLIKTVRFGPNGVVATEGAVNIF